MRIELLYIDACPNWKVAEDRLTEALAALDRRDVVIERRLVETPEQAEQLRFLGSPTIRIDGVDPFATGEEKVALACRVYVTPVGPRGSPETVQLREALR